MWPQAQCQQEPAPCWSPTSHHPSALQTGGKTTSECFMPPASHQSALVGTSAPVRWVRAVHAQEQAQRWQRAPWLLPAGHRAHPHCHRKTPADLFWLPTREVVTKSSSTFCRQKTWTSAKKKKMTSPRSHGDVSRTRSQWLESCRAALAAQERTGEGSAGGWKDRLVSLLLT